jgi:hypothetical protein
MVQIQYFLQLLLLLAALVANRAHQKMEQVVVAVVDHIQMALVVALVVQQVQVDKVLRVVMKLLDHLMQVVAVAVLVKQVVQMAAVKAEMV